jgi:hypothetical protein
LTIPRGAAVVPARAGRRALGIHFHQGAVVDRFALVAEEKAK